MSICLIDHVVRNVNTKYRHVEKEHRSTHFETNMLILEISFNFYQMS